MSWGPADPKGPLLGLLSWGSSFQCRRAKPEPTPSPPPRGSDSRPLSQAETVPGTSARSQGGDPRQPTLGLFTPPGLRAPHGSGWPSLSPCPRPPEQPALPRGPEACHHSCLWGPMGPASSSKPVFLYLCILPNTKQSPGPLTTRSFRSNINTSCTSKQNRQWESWVTA